ASKAARALGMSQLAFRRANMLELGDTTATGQTLDFSVGSRKVLDAVAAAAPHAPPPASRAGVRRGRGLAFYYHGAGFTGSGEQRLAGRATVAVGPGRTFEVRSSSTDIGQGTLTIFSQLAATALGVDTSQVIIADQSTAQVP